MLSFGPAQWECQRLMEELDGRPLRINVIAHISHDHSATRRRAAGDWTHLDDFSVVTDLDG